jgi:hypothetical protein
MVHHHIHDNCYALLMTGIDKFLYI